jgi:hypothetical protein
MVEREQHALNENRSQLVAKLHGAPWNFVQLLCPEPAAKFGSQWWRGFSSLVQHCVTGTDAGTQIPAHAVDSECMPAVVFARLQMILIAF